MSCRVVKSRLSDYLSSNNLHISCVTLFTPPVACVDVSNSAGNGGRPYTELEPHPMSNWCNVFM